MAYHVDVSTKGGYVFDVQGKAYGFSVDMKGEAGINPLECLLASIASCVGVYIRKYLDGSKLDIPEFSVGADAELTKEAPMRFAQVNVTIDFKGAVLDERRRQAFLEFIKNCPVHNSVKGNPDFSFTVR